MLDYIISDNDVIDDKCTWNGVIHKNADCYFDDIRDLETYILSLKDIVSYYIILHNKQENGTVDLHYHFIVCFSRKTSLSKIRKLFVGAHIEETGNKQASIQYLVHRTVKAKQQNKEEYLYQDIVTNDTKAKEKFISLDMQIASKENGCIYQDTGEVVAPFTDNALLEDFNLPYTELIKKYGSKQVKTKMPLINQLQKQSCTTHYDELMEKLNSMAETIGKLMEDNELLKKQLDNERELVDKNLPF